MEGISSGQANFESRPMKIGQVLHYAILGLDLTIYSLWTSSALGIDSSYIGFQTGSWRDLRALGSCLQGALLVGSEEGGLSLLLGRFNSMKKQKIYTYVLLIKHEKVLLNFGDTI